VILLLLLCLNFNDSFAKDPLQGKSFSSCEKISNKSELEYVVEYMSRNEEFEAEVYHLKSSKPCKGDPLFAIGRIWKYELNQNELITTLDKVKVIVLDKELVPIFNSKQICGAYNWEIDKVVSCEGKRAIDLEEIPGYRTIHKFKLLGKKMIVTEDDGESFELQLMK
jgi:hypothetical protein